ncbi:Uncharacterised protein [Vibrio cholerae]|nr:Uncharacterised protein [Vibrio cholerae]
MLKLGLGDEVFFIPFPFRSSNYCCFLASKFKQFRSVLSHMRYV